MSLHMLNYCDFRSPKVLNVLFEGSRIEFGELKCSQGESQETECVMFRGFMRRGRVIANRRKSAEYTIMQLYLYILRLLQRAVQGFSGCDLVLKCSGKIKGYTVV